MLDFLREISKDELIEEVRKIAERKARFMNAFCADLGDELEATYCFNHSPGLDMDALRIRVGKEEEVPSITGIYLAALLSENEMKEQFGLKVKGIAVDFGGYMLLARDSPVTPMLKQKPAPEKGSD